MRLLERIPIEMNFNETLSLYIICAPIKYLKWNLYVCIPQNTIFNIRDKWESLKCSIPI